LVMTVESITPTFRHGPPELVIRLRHPWLFQGGRRQAVPMLPRRRDQIREPVEKLKRQELDDAVRRRQWRRAGE